MSIDIDDPPHQSAASLVTGILGDLQSLVEQQFRLTVREVDVELRRRAGAGIVVGIAAGLLLTGGFALCLTAAHLMHWMASPMGTDPAWFPLWACYAVASLVLFLVGGIVMSVGQSRLRRSFGCQVPAVEFNGEKDEWTTQPK